MVVEAANLVSFCIRLMKPHLASIMSKDLRGGDNGGAIGNQSAVPVLGTAAVAGVVVMVVVVLVLAGLEAGRHRDERRVGCDDCGSVGGCRNRRSGNDDRDGSHARLGSEVRS